MGEGGGETLWGGRGAGGFFGARFTHYLDCGGDFMGTFLCPNIANYTLQIHAAYCMPIIALNKGFKNTQSFDSLYLDI